MREQISQSNGHILHTGILTNGFQLSKSHALVFSTLVLVIISNAGCLPVGESNTVTVTLNLAANSSPAKAKQNVVKQVNATSANEEICNTPRCLKLAENIKNTLDANADPCKNFYEYACGGWFNRTKIPKHRTQYSTISQLSENNEKILQNSLEANQSFDTGTIMKVKNFYRSCMDMKTIDHLGSKPLVEYINSLGSWQLDEEWEPRKWDFHKVLRHMHKSYPSEILFTVDVIVDPVKKRKDRKYVIIIEQAALQLPQIVYFVSRKHVREMWKYMVKVANSTGAEHDPKQQMRDVLKFEAKLAMISVPKIAKRYVRITVKKLQTAVPEFPWLDHLKAVFAPREVQESDHVVVLANDYLPEMVDLVRKTPKRTLSNYMVWKMIKDVVPMLSRPYRRMYDGMRQTMLGSKLHKPRQKTCFGHVNSILGPLLGSLFIHNAFGPDSKEKVEIMMNGIINAFKENANDVGWIDKDTVKAVQEKVDAAVYKVGYPDYLWNETSFRSRYEELDIRPGQWFKNVINTDRFANYQAFNKLDKRADKHQWMTVPQLVNAFYVINKNEIVIPAGILQPPFFYQHEIPRSISYGAIGHVLGHELTHGFDTTGRKFDKNGQPLDKRSASWTTSSIKEFEDRAKCLVEQFSEYKVLGKFHINGLQTLGENIADGGGVKLAFHAYENYVKEKGREAVLPHLNMTSEELFFIGYAQKECTKTTPLAEFLSVTEDVHALSKFRVIGTLSNFKEFSDVYKCKLGDAMNPKKKCSVW